MRTVNCSPIFSLPITIDHDPGILLFSLSWTAEFADTCLLGSRKPRKINGWLFFGALARYLV
jgi:hypothetical protein